MGLACPGMLATVEEAKEVLPIYVICFQALVGSAQIFFFKKVCLFFEPFCCKNKVIWYNGKFVEHDVV